MIILQTIAVAFAMFSAIPVPQFDWNEKNMRYAMCAFPLIGAVCGALWCLCGALPLPALVRAGGFCLIPVWVTGGIHLDGYADTCDALSSYGGREKKLEILKDPHCGAFAVIRLCSYFLAYFALCTAVQFTPRIGLCWTLALVLERALSGLAIASFPLARNTGLAHTFASAADRQAVCSVLLVLAGLLCAALVLLGGVKRIGSVSEKLVPFMALTYVVLALGVVLLNLPRLPEVFTSIVAGAFNPAAFTGGAVGSLFLSMQKGVSRGIFSNEAGLGTGSIAHACADTKKPVKQGMFGIFEVFADTIVICTLTALVILCSGTSVNYGQAAGAELTISGFTLTYGGWASLFTAVALCCFAFSTIIGWGLYGSRCIEYLFHTDKVVRPFLVVYSFVAILGATVDLGLLWSIADTFNGLMSIPNLIALLLLSGTVAKLVKEFFAKESQ